MQSAISKTHSEVLVMIEIRLLEQLSALEEHGTLSAAAVKLHTSQSALTRSMKKLESELGVELFHRAKNRITLNKTGRKAAEYARQVLAAGRDFEDKTRAFDRQERTLSVGFCAPVPQAVLTPILNDVFDTMTLSIDMSGSCRPMKKLFFSSEVWNLMDSMD